MTRTATALSPSAWVLALAAAVTALAAVLSGDTALRLMLISVATTFMALFVLIQAISRREARLHAGARRSIADFVAQDAAPCLTADRAGRIVYANAAAEGKFGACTGQTLGAVLGERIANTAAVLYRLQSRASGTGAAREDVVTRSGHLRVSVHQIGRHGFLWRFDEAVDRSISGRGAETLSLPMLTASKGGAVLFMNDALRRIMGGRVRTLDRIFPYLPLRSGEETEVAGAEGPLRAIVAELEGPGGRREIYLLPGSSLPATTMAPQRDALEDLPVALLKLGPRGEVHVANRLARDLLGIEPAPDQALPSLARLIEGPGRPVATWLGEAMAGSSENRPQVLRARRPDREVHVQVTLRRFAEEGRPGLLAVLIDATELKSLEAQFVQGQKMQAIGQLAGGVAHDFNNLLTAISGHCDLLLLRHDASDPEYADLIQIHQNANRAASLVRQLLAFSRKQPMKPEQLDLRDTLADLTHLLNRLVGERIRLVLDHDSDLRPVLADKRQFEQVIMNLVVNARDAMPEGGEVRITTENHILREDCHRGRVVMPAGDYVRLTVRDEGVGIPSDKLDEVFEPFFTTKRSGEGTGLGLSTVYGIIKQFGGFVFAESTVGMGTVFTILLPVKDFPIQPRVEERRRPLPPRAGGQTGGVIMLVEDEAPVRAFAARALQLHGFTVIEAETAEDALERLADPSLTVDLFLTDVVMPGMDGPTWVRQALAARSDTRVIFVSGYAETGFGDALGPDDFPEAVFLPKPFSLAQLVEAVRGQLN